MTSVRQPLYQRLPEIYRIKDQEQVPPGQLKAFVDILDSTQSAISNNIEALYHDLFIESCHDWVIPYLADLLGTSHLSGLPWTLRTDVARTIKHRRRKGTLGAIESLTFALTRWASHTVELRDRIVWDQHLNHQRPDRNGQPPLPMLIGENQSIAGAVQGGTVNLRDPALLSFYNGPFDPFAKVIDVKPVTTGAARHNFPNLAIFLWRLVDYTLPVIQPDFVFNQRFAPLPEALPAGAAEFVVGFNLHPLGEPIVAFNTHRYQADDEPPDLTSMDAVPGPMPTARLSENTLTGNPESYLAIEFYTSIDDLPRLMASDAVGLTLYLPDSLSGANWTFRGANLCAWQDGLAADLSEYEIAVDPVHGRILFGVTDTTSEADLIQDGLFVSLTYGFSGPTGAQPIVRKSTARDKLRVDFDGLTDESGTTTPIANGLALQQALDNLPTRAAPLLIEIQDSRTYDLNINAVAGVGNESGLDVLRLSRSLHIRAASGQRPIVRLFRPLAFRPEDVNAPEVENLNVTLEGLYLTWDKTSPEFAAETALIQRAALNTLTLSGCTLDPGSHRALNGMRHDVRYSLNLNNDYGFDPAGGEDFEQIPSINIERSILGPIAMDDAYELVLQDSILDAASGVQNPSPAYALHSSSLPITNNWGPNLQVRNLTCFGRMRVEKVSGEGGIWLHSLEVHNDLAGCIKFSYFSGIDDKLPQHQACVFGTSVSLSFASETFGDAGYGQIRQRSDDAVLEQGPNSDAMGAFGYLMNTHKWKNVNIRYREFMPVGVTPVLIPVT